ncbi:Jas TPL-binding domain containing protein [Trema orientale]|uniref:Jas TPL-binding domain containing protein n=1 Tax=Trema orientale TaxID=63057 RepID=A0A2P5CMQ2_TREOI|nr:Jas TPL-binding domain containing protein [Trema orientale]
MPRDAGCLTDGEMGYDNSSRIEPKRGQWFMDANGPQLFNKKQAMEAANGRPVSGVSHMNVSPWDYTSGFQSVPGQFTDRLFGSEPVRTVNLVDRNIQSIGSGNMNVGRKSFENQYGSSPSVGLSMSHTIEDASCLNFGGIRKVKVNQVRDSENTLTASMGNSFSRVENSTISMGNSYNKSDDNTISLGPTYNNGEENNISMGPTFTKADESFISVGHTFNKGDGNFISMGHNYSKSDNSLLSMGQPYDKGDGSFISMSQSYERGDGNVISLGTSYNKGHEDFISIGATYGKGNDNFIQMAPSYVKGKDNMISMGPAYKADSNVLHSSYDKGESGHLSMGQNYNKGESTTISFGGFQDESETNPSGGIISSYDLLMSNQNSAQTLEASSGQKISIEANVDHNVNGIPKSDSKTDTIPKNKEPKTVKKAPPNNFPSNVKSLLSTGMFDGVPKNLKGVIKGTGYLCSCEDCNHSKSLNAYEFERHAGCKTKHPNNHIYFENGKTIYAVVQELKNTPQEMLFDAIQNVTGSPINQKNFRIWKASYQAATRELQRIYGKDEVTIPS